MGNETKGFASHPELINKRGRPKKNQAMTEIIRRYGRRKDIKIEDEYGEEKYYSRKDALALKLWQLALQGDMSAIKYIYDRLDGRPKETVEVNDITPHSDPLLDAFQALREMAAQAKDAENTETV